MYQMYISNKGGNSPDKLHDVMVPLVKNSDCDRAYGGEITDDMICAGIIGEGGVDACQVSPLDNNSLEAASDITDYYWYFFLGTFTD